MTCRPRLAGTLEHRDTEAALRGAPRDGKADGTGANDDDIG